jgi:predicted RNA-binding protein with PUA-like domain
MFYLAKSEPESYSIDDLMEDKCTWWDGVHNYQALSVMKNWKKGDFVFFYRSVKNPAIVGVMKVIQIAIKDNEDIRGFSWKSEVEFVAKFNQEITLKEIKKIPKFQEFALVKQSRLSIMACSKEFTSFIFNTLQIKEF